jgi:TolB protein
MSSAARLRALIGWLCLCALSVSACAKKAPPVPTAAPTTSPTATTVPLAPLSGPKDVMIVSADENGYAHLFAYVPGKLTLNRLTWGSWNDVDPSMSPDGRRVAFASNRDGFWDLFTLDLQTGQVQQLTNTPAYDASPTWSPDLAWIAYETDVNGTLLIALLSLNNPNQTTVMVTTDTSSNYSPAWAPNGRQIAFVSNRSGNADVWLADLDKTGPDRFTNLSHAPHSAEDHPVWNAAGNRLAWASTTEQDVDNGGIYVWDASQPDGPAVWIGDGDWPAWNAQGDEIVAGVDRKSVV